MTKSWSEAGGGAGLSANEVARSGAARPMRAIRGGELDHERKTLLAMLDPAGEFGARECDRIDGVEWGRHRHN